MFTLLFELERGRTDRLDARIVQLCIRSTEPPGEYRYENWTKTALGNLSSSNWRGDGRTDTGPGIRTAILLRFHVKQRYHFHFCLSSKRSVKAYRKKLYRRALKERI